MGRRSVGVGLLLTLAALPLPGCGALLGIEDAEYRQDATLDADGVREAGTDADDGTAIDSALVDAGGDGADDGGPDIGSDGSDVGGGDAGDFGDAADGAGDAPPDADPCVGVSCSKPPAAACTSATELTTYDTTGTCAAGVCSYASHKVTCGSGCTAGTCATDPCASVTCNAPPAASCASGTSLRTYAAAGTCAAGACTYAPTDTACPFGCIGGKCSADPCAGVSCTNPAAPTCANATTRRTYAATGTCASGVCSYAPTDAPCATPPAASCASGTVRRTYASAGSCASGTCSYAPSDTACGGTTPFCFGGACGTKPPSCATPGDGRDNCGPAGNESCCASLLVTGIATASFSRSYDGVSGVSCDPANCNEPKFRAQISDFKLDKYEITVARFRQYVDAVVAGWKPSAGAGKHTHLNGGNGLADGAGFETGWDAASWNDAANFQMTRATWDGPSYLAHANCGAYATWTPSPGANERKPVNCIDWYDAAAFCIWDGGFLPSEAEWNYAAAGGTEQRMYPWGSTALGANATLAIYRCYFNGSGSCSGVANVAPVGSAPAGNGKYGQSDLAGNVGEWTLDWYASPYAETTCSNCSYLPGGTSRIHRGGSYADGATVLLAGTRDAKAPYYRNKFYGARCARTP